MDKDYLIEKWLKGDLTASEREAFDRLDDAEFNNYIVDTAKRFKADQFSEADDFTRFKHQYNSKKSLGKKWFSGYYLLKIASIVVIALGVYFTFFFDDTEKIKTLASQKITIELPDNSIVELNAGSEIEYHAKDWQKSRNLKLHGEAFFRVAKGKTFTVETKNGTVEVIGTVFNVKQRDHFFEVKCYEGVVKVTSNIITKQLQAGDVFKLYDGVFSAQKISGNGPTWLDNMSTFEAIPIKEVLAELERQYQVEVVAKNMDVNRLFTGAFEHNNIKKALIAITQPMGMTYELSDSNLVIIHGKNN
ncbi:FecR family protein [Aestuariivivens insulae]|uniref:FecR family protein n=1 Tax=Aestuariivivens insulae TaxID=1621988 RepID=UPI001F58362B|nr:FecR family protein [Aestuariivivens insulae]